MAQIKIEITFDPAKETMEQALSSLTADFHPSHDPVVYAKPQGASSKPKTETPKTETPKTETPKTETPKTETPKAEQEKITLTDVRAVATALSKAGKKAELKEVFASFGASKLSDIAESDYAALKEKLEAVNA